jgi:AraC-like DNA-binding protein
LNYIQGGFALIGLTLSAIFFFLAVKWMVKHPSSKGVPCWLSILSIIAFIQYGNFLFISFQLYHQWPILYCLIDPITVLLPLCLYGQMRALEGHNILSNKVMFLRHLIPSVVVLIIDVNLWTQSISSHISSISIPIETSTGWFPSAPHGNAYWLIVGGLSLFYWWRQKQHGYKSNVKPWVKRIQLLLLMTAFLVVIKVILFEAFGVYISMAYIQGCFALYFVYTVLNFSVHSQAVHSVHVEKQVMSLDSVENTDSDEDAGTSKDPEASKDSSKALSTDELTAYQAMFHTLEESLKNGAYRDNELSLRSLAASCNLTYHQASTAINHLSGVNFYEWIRLYRIAESKEILAKTNLSVSTIYYDVGFNSKSSFYTAFKKTVGCTPTEYRKSLEHKI